MWRRGELAAPRTPVRRVVAVTRDDTLAAEMSIAFGAHLEVAVDLDSVRAALDSDEGAGWLVDAARLSEAEADLLHVREHFREESRRLVWLPRIADGAGVPMRRSFRRDESGECIALLQRLSGELTRPAAPISPMDQLMGASAEILRVREQVRRVSLYSGVPTLILGESGSGRTLVAAAIHELAHDAGDAPLVTLHCDSLCSSTFEAALFGTDGGPSGALEQASGGTLLLDDVDRLSFDNQASLAKVLEDKSYRPIGSTARLPLNARVVSTTTRHLSALEESNMRPDLFYRVAGFTILVPSLKDRMEDLPVLASQCLSNFRATHGRGPTHIDERGLDLLMSHHWPANLHELRGTIEQAAVYAQGEALLEDDLADAMATRPSFHRVAAATVRLAPQLSDARDLPPSQDLRALEEDMITSAFERCGRNMSRTSRELAIPRSTLRDKLRRYGVV